MCSSAEGNPNALINAQNHGTILVMVGWFLACVLALCTVVRFITRCRTQRLRRLPLSDDAMIAAALLCGLGTIIVITTAVDSGLGKRRCLLTSNDMSLIQIKVFASTVLFILALSISKCSILLFFHQLADNTIQKLAARVIGIIVIFWTLAVTTGTVFQCEMPKPWEIWTGKCIPLLPFWMSSIAVDMFTDIALIALAVHIIWTLQFENFQKAYGTFIILLRLLLVGLSCTRIYFLLRALSENADPTFDYIPYSICTLSQSTLSILLACSLVLKPIANLLHAVPSQSTSRLNRHSKHWSGTTVGGTPYESYESFGSKSHLVKEPLQTIQRSMSSPSSPAVSRHSIDEDILLPEILMPGRYAKPPPRPPRPSEEQRPDLSMFTKTTCIRHPPAVTRVGSRKSMGGVGMWESMGLQRDLKARGLA